MLDIGTVDFPDLPGALCEQVDPDLWFPNKGGSVTAAKLVCRDCPVRSGCLEYALTHDERFGIWGGLSEKERKKLRKARRLKLAS
jgi:WhiB family redox-sensing transcriptional regulator